MKLLQACNEDGAKTSDPPQGHGFPTGFVYSEVARQRPQAATLYFALVNFRTIVNTAESPALESDES